MTGTGTALDPYIISDATDLQNVENDLTAYYELAGNIDATATSGWNSGEGFEPIGQAANFTGHFDGKGYVITSLFRNKGTFPLPTGGGLFKTNAGTVQNVGLTGCDITANVAGSIAGVNAGTITKCYSTGAVKVDTLGGYAGGFVCDNSGTITNSYTRCSVTGESGDRCGGFTQENSGTIDDCYSTGAVSGASFNAGFNQYDNGGTITNCFWDTETSGQASSDGGTGKTTAQMKTQSTFTDAGWDFADVWKVSTDVNGGYPNLTGYAVFPADAMIRVTNLIHRYNRKEGVYTLEMNLGEVTSDFGLPEWLSRPMTARPPEEPVEWKPPTEEQIAAYEPPAWVKEEGVAPTKVPEPTELTDRTKEIMKTPAAKALETRIAGLKAGVEAVVTPYAIDVLRQKEKEASTLMEIQRLQSMASATGITSYTRGVLLKKIAGLKSQLKTLYGNR